MPKSSPGLCFSDLKCIAPFLCLILHFAKSIPDLFRPDSTITKDQADLSLTHICVINNSQLRIESGCCARCQVDSRLHSISVSYYTPWKETPLRMKQLLYHFSLYFHLQEICVLDWLEDGGYQVKAVPVTPR